MSPDTVPEHSDDEVVPFRGLLHWGLVTEAGVESP